MKKLIILFLSIVLGGFQAMASDQKGDTQKNVFGDPLAPHASELQTGFYRDGYCRTDDADRGQHAVAAIVTKEFLEFTKSKGNDLQTPSPQNGFPGLKPGDKWCLCTARWQEAEKAGVAPPIDLAATNQKTLMSVPLETLKKYHKP